jgi:hypothetical protein
LLPGFVFHLASQYEIIFKHFTERDLIDFNRSTRDLQIETVGTEQEAIELSKESLMKIISD